MLDPRGCLLYRGDIAEGSFRGVGFAREPGSHEHGLAKPKAKAVVHGFRARPLRAVPE